MKRDPELDPLLSSEETIVPSSGFTESVMRAVRAEVVEPPPIPFPWKRAIPGLVSALLLVVSYGIASFSTRPGHTEAATQVSFDVPAALNVIVAELMRTEIQMAFLVLVLTLVVAKLSVRIHSERQ